MKRKRSAGNRKQRGEASGTHVLCIKNDGYIASLELKKLYCSIPDKVASQAGLTRVVDESGEDYLYPKEYFVLR